MKHRGDGGEDQPLGHQTPGGGSAPAGPDRDSEELAGPQLGEDGLADKLDVDPERGDVKG